MADKTPSDVQPNSFAAWVACIRPKTWGVAIAPVAVGLSFAFAESGQFQYVIAVATLLLSILMQAISNMENDAGYTKRKAESSNRKGLPRATSNGWLSVAAVESAIKLLAVVAAVDTGLLIWHGGPVMALISVSSIIAAYCYMGGKKPIAYSPFGELVVFIFFGLVAVCGTYYLQTGTVSLRIVLVACAIGLIAASVLAVNNFRDIDHDRSVGRTTLAVVLGKRLSVCFYSALVLLPYLLIVLIGVYDLHWLPVLIALPTIFFARRLITDFRTLSGLELNQVLFSSIKLELLFSLLITLGATFVGLTS